MHHRAFLTACLLGAASWAAATTPTCTSKSTVMDATTSEKPALFDPEQFATIEDRLNQFQKSHMADDEFKAYLNFKPAEETAKPLKHKKLELDEFDDQLEQIEDVDVTDRVTMLPSSIQPYMRIYYAGQASIVDAIRTAKETPATKNTCESVSSSDKETTKATVTTRTSPVTTRPSTIATVTISRGSITRNGTSTTSAPIHSRTSTSLSSPLSTASADAAAATIASSTSSSSSSLPNAASQATAGVLKAAGALAVGLAWLVVLV